ncbi:MAG: serine/threonine-protein kinase [Thermoplasmata archaeon]
MSLKIKLENKDFALMMTHNRKIKNVFTILNFVSIISFIILITLILLVLLKQQIYVINVAIPLLLTLSLLAIIPSMITKQKENGYSLSFIYLYIFFIDAAIRYGRMLSPINGLVSDIPLNSARFIISVVLINDLFYIMLSGFLISFTLTFLIWGFSIIREAKDLLISGFLIISGFIYFDFIRLSLLSFESFIFFISTTVMLSAFISFIESKDTKSRNFFAIFSASLPIVILAGIPFNQLSIRNAPVNQVTFNFAILALQALSLLIIVWLTFESVENLVFHIKDKMKYSAIINVGAGGLTTLIFMLLFGNKMFSLYNTYSFFTSMSNILYMVLIFFIVFFVLTLLIFMILGVKKIKTNAPIIWFLFAVLYTLVMTGKSELFIPSTLIFGSVVTVEYLGTSIISRNISQRFFGGKSLLDKTQDVKINSQDVDSLRPPLCWVKSGFLEGYTVRGIIGVKSGFGYVLDAYDPSSRRRVAIKVLKEAGEDGTPIAFDANTLNKFNEEHLKLKNLKGIRNIVSIIDTHLPEIERYNGVNRLEAYMKSPPYIVMEFLTGGSLSDGYDLFTKKEYIRPLLLIITGVADGLYEAHSKGIIHGDIKPDNILFSSVGRYTFKNESVDPQKLENSILKGYLVPKLTDFGTAKVVTSGRTTFSTATVHYAPPEILVNQNVVDQRYDIYELGLLLYYELAGVSGTAEKSLNLNKRQAELSKFINQGKFFDSPDEIIKIMEAIDVPDLRNINSGVSERLNLFIRRAIEPNPSKRPKSMKDFSIALKSIAINDYNFIEIKNY